VSSLKKHSLTFQDRAREIRHTHRVVHGFEHSYHVNHRDRNVEVLLRVCEALPTVEEVIDREIGPQMLQSVIVK